MANGVSGTGLTKVALKLPDGSTIQSVHYAITHANGYMNGGDVNVGDSTIVAFQVGGIPAATNYSISLTAKTADQLTCTGGPSTFDVTAGGQSMVMMTLHCGAGSSPSTKGQVRVGVDIDVTPQCPAADGLTASPIEVAVGKSISLHGDASSTTATFNWTVDPAASGQFSAASAADTSFTCSQGGTSTVTLHVAGPAPCPDSMLNVPVVCTPTGGGAGAGAAGAGAGGAGAGGAGAGGAGTGSAGTGVAGTGVAGTGVAGTGVAGTGGAGAGGAGGGTSAACTTCRNTNCTNYQGQLNLVSGCFQTVDTTFGATAGDPTFIQNCVDVMNCAFTNKCGYGANGSSDCFCGTAQIDACLNTAGAANGPCVPQFQAAVRSTVLADISTRISDLAFPMGWANFMLECDTTLCKTDCAPSGI